jgi:MoxR-like ATPase
MSDWHIFKKNAEKPHNDIAVKGRLPEPPKWRNFTERRLKKTRGSDYKPSDYEVEMVNAALYLRRPLLVTGNPGSGKSSLAYAVAWQLNLGDVLWWPINSRSTLQEGLYNYDALGRLRDLNVAKIEAERQKASPDDSNEGQENGKTTQNLGPVDQIGRYLRLGPLGTALYGGERPRVLLIDEIDKSDIDLPNDLLHVLEEAAFDIPELQRLTPEDSADPKENADKNSIGVKVYPHDGNSPSQMLTIKNGRVECNQFPFIVLTSNAERELPPAFKRRCLSLDIEDPKGDRLRKIVLAHISEAMTKDESDNSTKLSAEVEKLVKDFEEMRDQKKTLLATDQLLNAVYLITRRNVASLEERDRILRIVLRELGRK